MEVTYHATQRFLERVLHKVKYSKSEFYEAKQFLDEIFLNVVPCTYARPFALPKYKGFVVVHKENTVITILDKKQVKAYRGRK